MASLFFDYVLWHYGRAYINGATVWANLMWFVMHFFSVPLILRTLFSPWKRMREEYTHGGFEDFMGMIVVNIMTRIIGFFVRIVILIVGMVSFIATFAGFILWSVVWTLLPIFIIGTISGGILLIFS